MKRICTWLLSVVMLITVSAGATLSVSAVGTAEDKTFSQTVSSAVIYLVPGYYTENGQTIFNTVTSDVEKLTSEECEMIHTPNVYRLTAEEGDSLPVPTTEREGYIFNGWWTIVDSTVTYVDTAPAVSETLYLYADWRTALSQPMNPVLPEEGEQEEYLHYMEIERAATGKKEKIHLFVSGTDVSNAEQVGYGGPVQFYNEWFELQPGDVMRIYISNLYGASPTLSPQLRNNARKITLEISGTSNTSNWLVRETDTGDPSGTFSGDYSQSVHGEPRMSYTGKNATSSGHFRIYIKFYDGGGTMTVYIENQD